MLNFSNAIIQFDIYVGLLFTIAGVFGNLLNIIVFYKTNFQNPTNFILFCCSWASLAFILIGLLTRVIAGGFLMDWTATNMSWCRARYYLGHVSLFVSISYMCYAAIDQFFATSQKERLRRLSIFTRVRLAILGILLFWLLHGIPVPILAQQVPTASGGLSCTTSVNIYLKRYVSYFTFPVLSAIVPIILLTIVGSLTYRNVSMLQGTNVRHRAQRHLTSMILLQTVCFIIGAVPYCTYYVYSAITLTTVKGPDRVAIENLIFQIVNTLYYFPEVSTFFIYLISSATFRDQVRNVFHIPSRQNRVKPSQGTAIKLRARTTKEEPIQILA
jgi:hypothetical protein